MAINGSQPNSSHSSSFSTARSVICCESLLDQWTRPWGNSSSPTRQLPNHRPRWIHPSWIARIDWKILLGANLSRSGSLVRSEPIEPRVAARPCAMDSAIHAPAPLPFTKKKAGIGNIPHAQLRGLRQMTLLDTGWTQEQAQGLLDSLKLNGGMPKWKPEHLQRLRDWSSTRQKDASTIEA